MQGATGKAKPTSMQVKATTRGTSGLPAALSNGVLDKHSLHSCPTLVKSELWVTVL